MIIIIIVIINTLWRSFHWSQWMDILSSRVLCFECLLDLKWNSYTGSIAKGAKNGWLIQLPQKVPDTCHFFFFTFTRVRFDQKWSTAAILGLDLPNPHFPTSIKLEFILQFRDYLFSILQPLSPKWAYFYQFRPLQLTHAMLHPWSYSCHILVIKRKFHGNNFVSL